MKLEFKTVKKFLIATSVGASFVILAFGCGSAYQTSNSPLGAAGLGVGGGTVQPPLGDEPPPMVKPGFRTASIINYDTVLESMITQTGQMPSVNTLGRFQDRIGMLSETGAVTTVNSSALQGIAATASDICRDLVDVEFTGATPQANLRFFNSITDRGSSAASQFTETATAEVVRRMARSFWQRNETPEELAMVSTGIQEALTANAGTSSRNMGLFVCTAMLSTVSAIEL